MTHLTTFPPDSQFMITSSGTRSVMNEIESWLAHLSTCGRSRRTVQTYRDALSNLNRFLAHARIESPVDISSEHLTSWSLHLRHKGCLSATLNLYTRVIQSWFGWLIREDRLFLNPAIHLTRTKVKLTLGRCPSEADMRRLLASLNDGDNHTLRDRALLEVAYATGARCEELVRLNEISFDLKSRTVILEGKGGRDRVVPLTQSAVRAVTRYRREARPQFLRGRTQQACFISQRAGHRMGTAAIAHVVKKRGANVGLVMSPHDIRRAFATHLLLRGAGLAHLRDLLGHADYSHLRAYLRIAPEKVLRAVRNSPLNR